MENARRDSLKMVAFPLISRGVWNIKISVADTRTIVILCFNTIDPENSFIKFFSEKASMDAFLDFLITQTSYLLDLED
jgi:hypothetical protein